MPNEFLRNLFTTEGVIDRPNVSINVLSYPKDSVLEVKRNNSDKFANTAKQIEQLVGGEKAIVFCSFVSECKEICSSLLKRNVKAYVYTGQTTKVEKEDIYQKMKSNDTEVVIATRAFILGIKISNIRHVVVVGLPESLSLLMLQFDLAGRDGGKAHTHLLMCECEDVRKQTYFINNCASQGEKNVCITECVQVWKYISKLYTGDCLREFQLLFLGKERISTPSRPDVCCTGCEIKKEIQFQPSGTLLLMLKTLLFLKGKGIIGVCESKIVDWMSGQQEKWMGFYFDGSNVTEPSFGSLNETPIRVLKVAVKATLRQCLSLDYVLLEFNVIPRTKCRCKVWSLSSEGIKIATGDLIAPSLPDPVAVGNRLSIGY